VARYPHDAGGEVSLVRLNDGCWINPDDVTEIQVNESADTITVRMRGGIGHCLSPDYGCGIYKTMDRIAGEINAARNGEVK
jgi:hypothetical protein